MVTCPAERHFDIIPSGAAIISSNEHDLSVSKRCIAALVPSCQSEEEKNHFQSKDEFSGKRCTKK